jgi:hypothetical protein
MKDAEWDGLEARLKDLSKLGAELQAWASKSGASLKEFTRHASKPGAPVGIGFHPCPTIDTDSVPGYVCFLVPSPEGECHYICVKR